MKYQLGTVIFEEIGGGYYLASLPTRTIKLALFELLAMRATPIDDKPEGEYLFISRKGMAKLGVEPKGNGLISEKLGIKTKPECECEKTSNEWKMYSLNSDGQCIHCGRQISPKPEKIEPSNIDFKSKTDWQVHFIMLEKKLNELIEAVNSLKGE